MLISCVMPTADRLHLALLALKCFQNQYWTDKELLVLDDGAECARALFSGIPGVRYFRYEYKISIGEKRNIGVAYAQGEIVVNWDDDDWSAPGRITAQVEQLTKCKKSVTGFHSFLYWDGAVKKAYCYRYGNLGSYAAGSSQCYRRDWALRHCFPHKSLGEDSEFGKVAAAANQLASCDANGLFVARAHSGQTTKLPLGNHNFPEVPKSDIPAAFFADIAPLS